MTLTLHGYEISEKIHQGISTEIYRGIRLDSGTRVILKLLGSEYPSIEELTRFRNEYDLSKTIKYVPGIVPAIELLNYRNGLVLVLTDMGGISLKQYLSQIFSQKLSQKSAESSPGYGLSLTEFLPIAIQLATTLGLLHEHHIVHKDIKPQNIIINPENGEVKITDFSIASRLSSEVASLSNPEQLEGTLAYMSPEQTGRMNRSLDYRSDYYSLGVTFYELLAGELPYESEDPLELIHCHIAKKPPSLRQFNPEITAAIEGLVLKLMAKAAEDRYQSARGLLHDLETCWQQLQTTGKISNFTPGESDRAGQLLIPQKLYGRSAEVAQLMETFERVANPPQPGQFGVEMMLVSGYSGIGKTALVSEVHKPIVKSRGYFISGKFDQYKRNIPYASLIQAFSELIRQLLTESETSIQNWKEKLLQALGNNGQVICDVIPEVELIIGEQPEVASLGPTESQNRFNRVFQQFMGVFTTKEHPLVIFLDDLQWADSASLKLIQLLLTNPESKYLLFIGAYRDNEVSPTHPTIQTIEKIAAAGTPVNNIVLGPLQVDHVRALIADTLTNSSGTEALADLLCNKTQGNPFFLTQLLKTLYAEDLLVYDFPTGSWQWNLENIQALGITDYNVVELMARNLQKLPEPTQEVLKLAACIGNQFSLDVLAIVSQESPTQTATDLWSALQTGLILPLSKDYKIPLVFGGDEETGQQLSQIQVNYKFLHDRVQQAAYSLIPEPEKQSTHLKIGQLLLKNLSETEREENIFALVNQLNYGIDLLKSQPEKDELANLNLMAGKKAKEATAYEAAVKYLNIGLTLLATDSWQSDYSLTLALVTEAMSAEYLNTNFAGSQSLGQLILDQATSLIDRIKVYELNIQIYSSQNQNIKAIETGMAALELLGVPLEDVSVEDSDRLKMPSLEEVDNLPEMSDIYKLAALRILMNLLAPVVVAKPEILLQIVLTQINLCLQYGHAASAALSYSWYGMLLCGSLGDIEKGYHAGQLALKLLERFNANSLKSCVYNLVYGFVRPWKKHIRESLEPLQEAIPTGLEFGELIYSSYCALNYCGYLFSTESSLENIKRKQDPYIELLVQSKNNLSLYSTKAWHQFVKNLQGLNPDKYQLIGDSFDEETILPELYACHDNWSLFIAYLIKQILRYIFKDYQGALVNAEKAELYTVSVAGFMYVATHKMYYSLALLALYLEAETSQQIEYLQQVEANQEKLQLWAHHCPMNFQHKYDLVAAEKARVLGQTLEAMELYDHAIAGAKENEYIQEEALANELAAEFYLGLGREKVAMAYMTDAYYIYAKWGATAKVQDLESEYPQLLKQLKQEAVPKTDAEKSTQTTIVKTTLGSSGALDLATVMKASLAISSEIVLDKLLAKLINILLENAGGEKAFLFLKEKGELGLAATTEVNQEAQIYQPLVSLGVSSKGFSLSSAEALTTSDLPLGVINYVQRTASHVMLGDAQTQGLFTDDPYIISHQVKSLLCAPIIKGSKLVGIIYLENNLTTGAFTRDRLKVLQLLSGQAAISLELARSVNEVQNTLAYLKSIINNIADGLLVTDSAGRITQFNPALSNLFSVPASELMGQHCTEILSSEIGAIVTQSFSHPTEVLSAEITLNSGRIGGAVATAITTDEEDEIIGCVTIIRDITAEKEVDRMKTDFISTVSHELRTPLTSVVGFAKIIHKKLNDKVTPALADADKKTVRAVRQIGDNINIIISEGERLTTLINDVLDIAKMEAGKIEWNMEPVNLGEIIDRAVAITSSLWQTSGLKLIKELPPELPEVNGDAARLLQVVINLISNAVKFTPSGSITLKVSQPNQQVIVSVIDTGVGINPADCEKVFEKFKQVGEVMTDKPQGTGLGLPICKQIIEHHQGRVWVESELGVGSNFSFSLPVESPSNGEAETLNIDTLVRQLKQSIVPKSSESTEEQKTILVVDDEPSIRTLLRQQLEEQGYVVKEAADGMEAISQVKLTPPDLIILDVMMPAINGFDVAAVLKNNPTTMDIPIIILSIVEDKQRGWKLGVDRYLTKPIDSDKLLSDIGVLISRGTSPKK
jgi:PAS domain S-box-containing protein